MNTFWLRASALAAGLCLSAVAQAAAVVGAYTVTKLQTLNGGTPVAYALNNAGQVVGYVHDDRYTYAALWVNGAVTALNVLDERIVYGAGDINNAGQVLGSAFTVGAGNNQLPLAWTVDKVPGLSLVNYALSPNQTINKVNDQGLLLIPGAQVLAPNGQLLRTLRGANGRQPNPQSINVQGLVVGGLQSTGVDSHAASWADVDPTDLGTLGGTYSTAFAVSADGKVVGESQIKYDIGIHAALWQGGVAIDLGTLGGANGRAEAVNTEGVVVGQTQTASGEWRAAVWYGTKAVDINTFVDPTQTGLLTRAFAVNEKGQILASTDVGLSYLLTPGGTLPQPPKPTCSVAYKLNNSNALFFTAQVTLSNLGDAALSGWSVGWTYSAKPYIVSSKGAKLSASANAVSASPLAANTVVAAKSSTVFSFTSLKGKTVPVVSGLKATLGGKDCVVSAP